MQIEKIMTKTVHTVMPSIALRELREIFSNVKYHHFLAVEDDRLVGVISDRDVLRMSSPTFEDTNISTQDEIMLDRQASTFMSSDLITARSDTLIDTAAILLLENNISCLPVVDNQHQIEGIVTWKDMLKYYIYAD